MIRLDEDEIGWLLNSNSINALRMDFARNPAPVRDLSRTDFVMDGWKFCIIPVEAELPRNAAVAVPNMLQTGKSGREQNHAHAKS